MNNGWHIKSFLVTLVLFEMYRLTTMATRRFCFAVIGSGRIGQQHLKSLFMNERSIVKYIVEENITVAQKILHKYKIEESVSVLGSNSIGRVYEDNE